MQLRDETRLVPLSLFDGAPGVLAGACSREKALLTRLSDMVEPSFTCGRDVGECPGDDWAEALHMVMLQLMDRAPAALQRLRCRRVDHLASPCAHTASGEVPLLWALDSSQGAPWLLVCGSASMEDTLPEVAAAMAFWAQRHGQQSPPALLSSATADPHFDGSPFQPLFDIARQALSAHMESVEEERAAAARRLAAAATEDAAAAALEGPSEAAEGQADGAGDDRDGSDGGGGVCAACGAPLPGRDGQSQ